MMKCANIEVVELLNAMISNVWYSFNTYLFFRSQILLFFLYNDYNDLKCYHKDIAPAFRLALVR